MMEGVRFEPNVSTTESRPMRPAAQKVNSYQAQFFYWLHKNFKSW